MLTATLLLSTLLAPTSAAPSAQPQSAVSAVLTARRGATVRRSAFANFAHAAARATARATARQAAARRAFAARKAARAAGAPQAGGAGPVTTASAQPSGASMFTMNATVGGLPCVPAILNTPGATVSMLPAGNSPMRIPLPNSTGLYVLKVTRAQSGITTDEFFLLQIPNLGIGNPTEVPLIVAFHGFSVSAADITVNTMFDVEADLRGWYLLAPMSGGEKNLASTEGQQNTQAAIDFVTGIYNIDQDRIYGVGFSMGGGTALNYACRYTDLREPRFAAVANHTGLLAQEHSWTHALPTGPAIDAYFNRYGGTPSTVPFEFDRASVAPIAYVANMGALDTSVIPPVDTTRDFGRNLLDIPMRSTMADSDPLDELRIQNLAFDAYMTSLGANHTLNLIPAVAEHIWSTLDAFTTCDWFSAQSRTMPTSGDFMADRDGRWFYFDVFQDAPGSFSRVDWNLTATQDDLTLTGTSNVAVLEVDSTLLGLITRTDFTVRLRPTDGTSDTVVIDQVGALPMSVLRDGMATTMWSHNALTGELSLTETDGTIEHVWTIDV